MSYFNNILFMIVFFMCQLAFAGAHEGGGQNLDLARIRLLKVQIEIELKKDTINFLEWVRSEIKSGSDINPYVHELMPLLDRDIILDIKKSSYKVLENQVCNTDKDHHDAYAVFGDLGGEICFSALSLSSKKAVKSELVGTAIHEHAHHLNYGEDKAYMFYSYALLLFQDYQAETVKNKKISMISINGSKKIYVELSQNDKVDFSSTRVTIFDKFKQNPKTLFAGFLVEENNKVTFELDSSEIEGSFIVVDHRTAPYSGLAHSPKIMVRVLTENGEEVYKDEVYHGTDPKILDSTIVFGLK